MKLEGSRQELFQGIFGAAKAPLPAGLVRKHLGSKNKTRPFPSPPSCRKADQKRAKPDRAAGLWGPLQPPHSLQHQVWGCGGGHGASTDGASLGQEQTIRCRKISSKGPRSGRRGAESSHLSGVQQCPSPTPALWTGTAHPPGGRKGPDHPDRFSFSACRKVTSNIFCFLPFFLFFCQRREQGKAGVGWTITQPQS